DSDRHPGVFDNGYNTHAIMDEAFHRAFDDAEVTMAGWDGDDALYMEFRNRRPFTLRQLALDLAVAGIPVECPPLLDLAPGDSITVRIPLPPEAPGPDYTVEGTLSLETHHGLSGHIPVRLFVSG
ncbi:MAG: hypothetical protein Q8N51_15285, partial [Gammaproteobacteria bacterium]|nr:hypothetical protein [Gammaproteobacteria bacterium]